MTKNLLSLLLAFSLITSSAFGQAVQEPPKKDSAGPQSAETEPQQQQAPSKDTDSKKKKDAQEDSKKESDKAESDKNSESKQDSQQNRRRRRSRRNSTEIRYSKRSEQFVSVFKSVVRSARDSVVEIKDGNKQIALGTVVGDDGLVITKASELSGEVTCVLPNGDILEPTVLGVDLETDLALLKLETENLATAPLLQDETPEVGAWIVTVNQKETPLAIGIVSHEARRIKNSALTSAIMGIFPVDRRDGEGVRINQVNEGSPADDTGLLVNDVIIEIDSVIIENTAELREKLAEYQPGDEIDLVILRGEEELEFQLTLGRRAVSPMMDRSSRQNRMGSTLSKRRSDFSSVLQHDAGINANQCGGPVVDIDGKIVGINIARDGRVSTLVLPNSVVLPVVEKLKTGEFVPRIVNQERIENVQQQLVKLKAQRDELPTKKSVKDIEFSASAAVEKEIKRQIDDLKSRLEKLEKRYTKQKNANNKLKETIAGYERRIQLNQRRREEFQTELKALKTGIR